MDMSQVRVRISAVIHDTLFDSREKSQRPAVTQCDTRLLGYVLIRGFYMYASKIEPTFFLIF